jgi:hypothetical protein
MERKREDELTIYRIEKEQWEEDQKKLRDAHDQVKKQKEEKHKIGSFIQDLLNCRCLLLCMLCFFKRSSSFFISQP